jgi:hypothetical protein
MWRVIDVEDGKGCGGFFIWRIGRDVEGYWCKGWEGILSVIDVEDGKGGGGSDCKWKKGKDVEWGWCGGLEEVGFGGLEGSGRGLV